MASLIPLAKRGRHVAFFVASAAALSAVAAPRVDSGVPDRRVGLSQALAAQGITAAPADVWWVDRPTGVWSAARCGARAVVRALPAPGEPNDIFLVETQLSPEGVLLDLGAIHNLTDTPGADESAPVIRGEQIAYVSRGLLEEATLSVHLVDLRGRAASGAEWTRVERLQNAITNYQQTGQVQGITRRSVVIDPPPREASVGLEEGKLVVRADGREARLPLGSGDGEQGSDAAWARLETAELSRPGNLVTWSVDRVRAVPWIGDEKMQTLKAVAFTGLDFVLRNKESITGDTGAEGIAADLGQNQLDPPTQAMLEDPEIGWPPPPLEPWVTPALPGEGSWNPQDKDPFVRVNQGLPAAFLTTFIRSDRTRKATRVYVALWDPRQIELHMMAGTVEPKGATGEAGPGLIPRTPEVMKRVVAASNAGFQALHGEFGMMADGVVYLPPKPYAATVVVEKDGSTSFGTWPQDPAIPPHVRSYRQNMTVMVEDEKFNPYGRNWWGGTAPGMADKTHTVRTGICLTKEHFVAYFYGSDIGPEGLSQAMIQTRCKYGLALDMNAGHSGLEFYKVAPAAELEPLGRPLNTDAETEGEVSGLEGWRFRGRRFIRGMGLMNFPRYIRRESRDFFYMTLRHVLPGAPLKPAVSPALDGEGAWRLKGLPQHGFPYALALAEIRPDAARADTKVRVLKIDPRTVSAAPAARAAAPGEKAAPTVAILDPGAAPAAAQGEVSSIWHSTAAFSIASTAPVPEAVRLATGLANGAASAGACVHDEDGMLIYAELSAPTAAPTEADGKLLDGLLKSLGCSSRVLLARPLVIALGGDTSLAGAATHPPSGGGVVRLARAAAPGAGRIFEDTPVVPFSTWYPLQAQRIRYFKKPKTEEPADGAGGPK